MFHLRRNGTAFNCPRSYLRKYFYGNQTNERNNGEENVNETVLVPLTPWQKIITKKIMFEYSIDLYENRSACWALKGQSLATIDVLLYEM